MVERSAACLLLVVLMACAGPPELPDPGLEEGLLHIWRPGFERPTELRIEGLRQQGSDLHHWTFTRLQAVVPLEQGLMVIDAPRGQLRVDQEDHGDHEEQDGMRIWVDEHEGPVWFSGVDRGQVFFGRAASVVVPAPERALSMSGVRLLVAGRLYDVGRLAVPQLFSDRSLSYMMAGEGVHDEPGPTILCALAGAVGGPPDVAEDDSSGPPSDQDPGS